MKHDGIPLLEVSGLAVRFSTRGGPVDAVRNVSLRVRKGQTIGIVGESGSGKSVTSYALLGILDRAGIVPAGEAIFSGMNLLNSDESFLRTIRGREISMIFQNPRAALNPIRRIGDQIGDVLIEHAQCNQSQLKTRVIELLNDVRIQNPEIRYKAYPFELSGGMCQRVVIAMALACKPQLLIADEPTTGLDVTTQRAVMDLIRDRTRSQRMSTILITHDLGLAGEYCDDIIVMEKGEIVEQGTARDIFTRPQHHYTQKLVRATPRLASRVEDLLPFHSDPKKTGVQTIAKERRVPLLEISQLEKCFPTPRTMSDFIHRRRPAPFRAVKGIGFEIYPGESVGLVGESGCGKSTTAAMIMRLLDPSAGIIRFKGQDISLIRREAFAQSPQRSDLQMVFQDATESLNPRFTAHQSIADPLRGLVGLSNNSEISVRVAELADMVGLERELLERLPHQLSGGQKARVGIARAIASSPSLLVLDEPTAALDVSVQAIVLNLLFSLRRDLGMAYLFVSHDLEVVRLLCDRVIVMCQGKIVEIGATEEVLGSPKHEYTKALLNAAPKPQWEESFPGPFLVGAIE
jgi:peptide/nickel transport system ATP-binding protein